MSFRAATDSSTKCLHEVEHRRRSRSVETIERACGPASCPTVVTSFISGDGRKPVCYVASLDPGEGTKLLVNALATSARLLLRPPRVRQVRRAMAGTLFAQRFDLDRLDLTGEPVAPAEERSRSTRIFGRGDFSVSATGSAIFGHRTEDPTALVWFDRQARSSQTCRSASGYHKPILSPDGKTIGASTRRSREPIPGRLAHRLDSRRRPPAHHEPRTRQHGPLVARRPLHPVWLDREK